VQKTTTGLATPLRAQLERLAAFEPTTWPVLSLYLDMRPDQHGRDNYDTFLRKALPERRSALEGEARESFDRDIERINEYLTEHASASANGVALFACARADDFFEAVQLDAPIEHHWLFVAPVPHLYPLARVTDQYPRYAALVADTNTARLFVFSLGRQELREQVTNEKTRRGAVGGWSQARYQRHTQNIHLQHMKEVATVLDRVVREETISQIVLACDEVTRPMLMEQLPKHLAEKVVDVVNLDTKSPEHVVLSETMDVLRQRDAETDAERVAELLDAWRGNGLAVVGADATLKALEMGQVEEVLLSASPEAVAAANTRTKRSAGEVDVHTSAPSAQLDAARLALAGQLVTRAHQSGARLRFIEDQALLADVGGVGATLRFRI
jgi:peptide subunit release factor 1 (eRF1)